MATGSTSRKCWLRCLERGRGRVKPVSQWQSHGSLGGSCHVSKWLQLQTLLSVVPNGCPEIKLQMWVHPSARAPQMGAGARLGGGPLLKASLICKVAQNQDLEKVRPNRDCALSQRPTVAQGIKAGPAVGLVRLKTSLSQGRPSSLPLHLVKDWQSLTPS